MNAFDPSNDTYPTAVQTTLSSFALLARFNRTGRLIAAGRADGSAVVWDLDTRTIVRTLEGHVKAITSIDWSRNSRYMLTSSKDWNVIVWDLVPPLDPPKRARTVRFDAPVLSASFHPRNSKMILAVLDTGEAVLVDSRKTPHNGRFDIVEVMEDHLNQDESDEERAISHIQVAKFDPSGHYILCGTAEGAILVFSSRTRRMIARHRVPGAGEIRGIECSAEGRRVMTNSSDRILRHFILPQYPSFMEHGQYLDQELEPTHRFSDPVSRNKWSGMSFSPDGEWCAGGMADLARHRISIWNLPAAGRLVNDLDGGKEPLTDIHWHPSAPSIASTTSRGNILVWHQPVPEKWGAFAGKFQEIDENVEYEELEDEFDIEDEDRAARRKHKEQDFFVDILSDIREKSPGSTVEMEDDETRWAIDDPDDDDNISWQIRVFLNDYEYSN